MEQSDACLDPGLPSTTCTYFGNEAEKEHSPKVFLKLQKSTRIRA